MFLSETSVASTTGLSLLLFDMPSIKPIINIMAIGKITTAAAMIPIILSFFLFGLSLSEGVLSFLFFCFWSIFFFASSFVGSFFTGIFFAGSSEGVLSSLTLGVSPDSLSITIERVSSSVSSGLPGSPSNAAINSDMVL
jgi:hypothetical protein